MHTHTQTSIHSMWTFFPGSASRPCLVSVLPFLSWPYSLAVFLKICILGVLEHAL